MKPRWRRWYVVWPVALVAAAAVAPWFALRLPASTTYPIPAPGDRVQQAIDALKVDHFYVGPEFADRMTPEQRQSVITALRSAKTPSYLVYWDNAWSNAGYYLTDDALDQIMKGVGVNGLYSIVDEKQRSTDRQRGVESSYLDPDVLQQRPAQGLLDYAKAMAAVPNQPREHAFDYWGGPGGGIAAGLLFAVLGYLGALVVMFVLGRSYRWFQK